MNTSFHRLAHTLLYQHFGYTNFRAGQLEIIESITRLNDTFVVMPTGGGKSLCYQLPALMLEGTALVISPLIALMQDQVRSLEKAGIAACFINSALPWDEIRRRLSDARDGKYKLVYVAPERLESKQFQEQAQRVSWSFLAVDEAHCVSEWGHDFRPAYLSIARANEELGRFPIIALTATATPDVQDDVVRQLRLMETNRFIRGFDRPNLTYSVEHDHDKTTRLADICAEATRETTSNEAGSVIVYCASRKRVEQFTQSLRNYHIHAEPYHAGLGDAYRRAVLERFTENRTNIIVATNAFGMGVDKPNVRAVVHCDLTLSLEAYYQEAGRAGRDGEAARCIMLYAVQDRRMMDFFLQCSYPDSDLIANVYNVLYDSVQAARGEKPFNAVKLSEEQIASVVGQQAGQNVYGAEVRAVLTLFERAGILRRGGERGIAQAQFLGTRERMREYHNNIPERRRNALNALARLIGSEGFSRPVAFDIHDVWRKHYVPIEDFLEAVRGFEYAHLVKFDPPGSNDGISLLLPRIGRDDLRSALPIDWQGLTLRRARAEQKRSAVEEYATTSECKRDVLLSYFGEADVEVRCGRCSSCREAERTQRSLETISHRKRFLMQHVLRAASELDGRFGKSVMASVLLGEKSAEKVRKFGLHRLVSFAAAKEFPKQEVHEMLETAQNAGYLVPTGGQFPTIALSTEGAKAAPDLPAAAILDGYNRDECLYPELFVTAQKIRTEVASLERVPPHAVLDESSLIALVNALPKNIESMKREVRHLGQVCMLRFAPLFLKAVQGFIAHESAQNGNDMYTLAPAVRTTIEMLRGGMSLQEVAEKRRLTVETLAQHIQSALEQGTSLRREDYVAEELYLIIRDYLRIRPDAFLKDIRAMLHTETEWHILRIAAAFARRELAAR
ncbi:MAG: RecQ family ATP-dependent DNA helicase [Candidatus Kapaibacterium sp.]|nr:MAG: RecQ family ATP-dependent DNA helicase [Candidatus Kapabacteria bacterium]